MAFLRTARTTTIRPCLDMGAWSRVRTASTSGTLSPNLVSQASDILGDKFSPSNYLLTHATIVASVDTYDVPNVRVGMVKEGSFQVNRKYADYRVLPECDQWINNNGDAWERRLLLSSYKTFIGAENYLEHHQDPAHSKGKIIDAVARDLGESVYVDILVATHRKHATLIADIESGRMNSMSMGCIISYSICTKCGHVAADETEMCNCIKYEKGNYFYDDNGWRHRVAELCGHRDDGGVTFIEASWVKVPAFLGAVLRNVLSHQDVGVNVSKRAQRILSQPPRKWSGDRGLARAAAFDFGDMGDDTEADSGGGEEEKAQKGLLEELEDEAVSEVGKRLKKRIRDEISPPPPPADRSRSTIEDDENIVRNASLYQGTIKALVRVASNDAALIDGVAEVNRTFGIDVPIPLYRVALAAGPTSSYASLSSYLGACSRHLGRKPSVGESKTLVRLGKLLAARGDS